MRWAARAAKADVTRGVIGPGGFASGSKGISDDGEIPGGPGYTPVARDAPFHPGMQDAAHWTLCQFQTTLVLLHSQSWHLSTFWDSVMRTSSHQTNVLCPLNASRIRVCSRFPLRGGIGMSRTIRSTNICLRDITRTCMASSVRK